MVTRAPASQHTWRLRIQVGLHGYEVLLTGHRLRGGRLGSRKCDGTGKFVQTVEGVVEVHGGEGSGKVGWVCEVVGVSEGSARKRAGLGGDECLAGWWYTVEKFCL